MPSPAAPEVLPLDWVRRLACVFKRVAVFSVQGTTARVIAFHGVPAAAAGRAQSLVAQTPLRWAIEAASPIVGAGNSPNGEVLPTLLMMSVPRAYVVIPIAVDGHVTALIYADNKHEP